LMAGGPAGGWAGKLRDLQTSAAPAGGPCAKDGDARTRTRTLPAFRFLRCIRSTSRREERRLFLRRTSFPLSSPDRARSRSPRTRRSPPSPPHPWISGGASGDDLPLGCATASPRR